MSNRPYVYFKDGDAVVVDGQGLKIEGIVHLSIHASPKHALLVGQRAICKPTSDSRVFAYAVDSNGDLLTEEFTLDNVFLGEPTHV